MTAPTLTLPEITRSTIGRTLHGFCDALASVTTVDMPVPVALGKLTGDLTALAITLDFLTAERYAFESQRAVERNGGSDVPWRAGNFIDFQRRVADRILGIGAAQTTVERAPDSVPIRVTFRAGGQALDATVGHALLVVPIAGDEYSCIYRGDAGQLAQLVGAAFSLARIEYGADCQLNAVLHSRRAREQQEEREGGPSHG